MMFCLICAWGHALLALKVEDSSAGRTDRVVRDVAKLMDAGCSVYDLMLETYTEDVQRLTQAVSAKTINLNHSYSEFTISAWWFFLFMLIGLLFVLV
ncbi:hypothetical protein GCM10007876_27780 [Litoribrevibacter albus]|uniref:Uncharacterized protein n=2 Tax=Litoribrevibacter albus TaxID=1473156 RepID=A0AA37SD06_9GAMM|nr:hypothetical protein GCM10007876_27780 [Litoribrevibacter albus]